MDEIFEQAQSLFEYTRALRRDLHRHPELGFHEVRTAGIVARELHQLGLEVVTGVAETGVVAVIEGAYPGPVALLRFDMDALPIQEETGKPYASENPGVMHACGHDGHVSIGLTVAKLLDARRDQIHGTVKLVFQPAEEGRGGAERMLAEGVLENPQVDFTLALHVWNERPVGWVGITTGPEMAGADIFTVRIEGRGGHGAIPQDAVDPIVAASQTIVALQSIVARNIPPLESAVISVCQIKAGEAFNVIPQVAEFTGTFRTFEPGVRERLIERFKAVVEGVAGSMGCKASMDIQRLTPAVINDPGLAEKVRGLVSQVQGLTVVDQYRSMVSEDMAFMMERVPGCFMMIGSANPVGELTYGHHHPRFDFNEAVLPNAVAVMTTAALGLLK